MTYAEILTAMKNKIFAVNGKKIFYAKHISGVWMFYFYPEVKC
jgi:hypothetical protein